MNLCGEVGYCWRSIAGWLFGISGMLGLGLGGLDWNGLCCVGLLAIVSASNISIGSLVELFGGGLR